MRMIRHQALSEQPHIRHSLGRVGDKVHERGVISRLVTIEGRDSNR